LNNGIFFGWAKRASGKPQRLNRSSSDQIFVNQIAQVDSVEEIVEAILEHSNKEARGSKQVSKATAQSLQRLRERSQQAIKSQVQSVLGQGAKRKAKTVSDFTGLKPMAKASETTEQRSTDKISKLARQLENLVLLAEDNQRDEARQGVRMAEDSHSAVAEGQQASGAKEGQDFSVDIEALRQEVLLAFEQELSMRSLRSFDESNNSDIWW